jgi:microcystin degradation protein MlrC
MREKNRRDFIRSSVLGAMGMPIVSNRKSARLGKGSPRRILVARFFDETNTFIEEKLTLEEVKKKVLFGNEMLRAGGMVHGTVGTALDGFVDCAEMFDVELVGSISVKGNHRMMTEDVFDFVMKHILESLEKEQVDAVYLCLHGAGVTEGHDDLEGDAMQIIRKKVGPDVPIAFSMDLHCTITKLMTEVADIVSVYRTYPHIDAYETGFEVASILMAGLFGKVKPVLSMAKIPLMIGPPLNVLTASDPMKQVYQRAREIQRNIPAILSCCPSHGFMQQDIPEQGAGVIVTADGDKELAQKVANEVAELMFSFREEFWTELPGPAETIRIAKQAQRPVAIADSGDNIGAGGAGDGTHLLHEILKQKVPSAFVQLYDPTAARKAFDMGEGSIITLEVGGWTSKHSGKPVVITGRVSKISDPEDAWHKAVGIDVEGVTILLNTERIGPNDQTNVRGMGIFPEKYAMCVCKGGFAFRPQYPPSIYDYILSATPGYSSPDLSTFSWKRIPRPIFPLDKM